MPKAKVLLYDIEIAPNLAYVWGKYEQNVIAYEKEFYFLSFAYKWLGQSKVHCKDISQYKSGTDKELVKELHSLFQEADVLIAHNGNSFDKKKACARFIFYELEPTKILSTIDTKLIAKRYFAFNSNSLDDLGEHLGLGRKLKHSGFDLWLGCMRGEKKCWDLMRRYNRRDVSLLEKVYLRFRPWIQNHPSIAMLEDGDGKCPNCGGFDVMKRGLRANTASLQQQFKCNSCSTWFLGRYKKDLK